MARKKRVTRRAKVEYTESKLTYQKTDTQFTGKIQTTKLIKPLNSRQKEYIKSIREKIVTLCEGSPGTSKTLLALHTSICLLNEESSPIEKIFYIRANVGISEERDIGMLPGPQPLDAKVLTPTGWKLMGELLVGDYVISRNGKPTKVINIYPKGIKEVFEIKTNEGSITQCCEDHLWSTQTWEDKKRSRKFQVRSTKDILNTLKNKKGKNNHYLPRNEAVEYNSSNELIIPPYTLGTLLGDSSLSDHVIFTNIDEKYNNLIKEELYKLGITNTNASNKFIPDIYKYSSIQNRLDLIRGLMDTKGTVKVNGEASFCTCSKQLALDIIEITKSLGGRATLKTKDKRGKTSIYNTINNNLISYEFTINLDNKYNPFYVSRKAEKYKQNYIHEETIESITKVGEKEVQCILVENPEHLYITDDFLVTHNTLQEKIIPLAYPVLDSLVNFMSEGNARYLIESSKIEVLPISMVRGRSFANSIVIVDECANCSPNTILTLLTRIGDNSKMLLLGNSKQKDTVATIKDGLKDAIQRLQGLSQVGVVIFKDEDIIRNSIIKDILTRYEV